MTVTYRKALLALAACVVATAAPLAQQPSPGLRELLLNARPLTRAQIGLVLDASRQALAGKAYRLTTVLDDAAGREGDMEVVMGPTGKPIYYRARMAYEGGVVGGIGADPSARTTSRFRVNAVTVTEFTGRPARGCDGAPRSGELIVQYRNEGKGWTASASTQAFPGFPASLFDMMIGRLSVDSGPVQLMDGRTARALVANWMPPATGTRPQPDTHTGDPLPTGRRGPPATPAAGVEMLWIDSDSLLPQRWERFFAADPARGIAAKLAHRLSFRYDSALTIARPAGVTPPDCVP